MILTPPTVAKLVEYAHKPEYSFAASIPVDKTTLRAILTEIQLQQNGMTEIDKQKADFIQKLTMEFTLNCIAETLIALAAQDWGKLRPAEVLMVAAQRVREQANFKPVEMIQT
jgi:hypothetical protein